MTLGPVQVLVVGYGEDAQFRGEALAELKRLTEGDIVRVIDLLFVHKNQDGSIDKAEISDADELAEFGSMAGALIGFGMAGEEGAVMGAGAGATALTQGMYDADQVWCIADTIPEGMSAAIAVLEHRWAIPLREAITRSGGVALADEWVHPEDLVAIGLEEAA